MADPISRLALYVESHPINKSDLARQMHLSRSMVGKMLKGQRRVSIDDYCRFCEVLDVDPRYFFTQEINENKT